MTHVFYISLPRSATRTFAKAYGLLHNPLWAWTALLQDYPIQFDRGASHFGHWHIAELTEQYPNARFLHWQRPLDDWLASWERAMIAQNAGKYRNNLQPFLPRLATFGQYAFNREKWVDVYERHKDYVGQFPQVEHVTPDTNIHIGRSNK